MLTTSVELVEHDANWARLAAAESECWLTALPGVCVRVHHIGSTSIAGIVAKPVLDLIPEFESLAALDASRSVIEAMGYGWYGEYGLPGRRYCPRNDLATGRRLVHAHCYASGSPEITRHLAFRDYLRAHGEIAWQYEQEKLRCRDLHPLDSMAYSGAKHAWIQRVQAEALEWAANRGASSLAR